MEMTIEENAYRQMRERVNFIPRSEYRKLGLTRTESERLDSFVRWGLDPVEISIRVDRPQQFVRKSINSAIEKIVKSDGYEEKKQKNWEKLRCLGLT